MTNKQDKIKLLVPDMPSASALSPYLRRIDKARQYTNFGPLVSELETGLAALLGVQHVVCVSSCTTAMELALQALDLPNGSKVALPSLTFPATGTAILRNGLIPVFCDVDPESYLLTPAIVGQASARQDIAAVMPVALFGRESDGNAWNEFAKKRGIPVIHDAAGAIGYHKPIGSTITAYSLHATKPLSAAEGGLLAFDDASLIDKVGSLSNFGFSEGEVIIAGTNGKMSEYHAAICLVGLETWPERQLKYGSLLQTYKDAFASTGAGDSAEIVNRSGIACTLTIRAKRDFAAQDFAAFDAAGIETRRWYYPPLHRHKLFANSPRGMPMETTDMLSRRLLGLPYHLFLSPDDIARVGETVARVLR